MSQKLPGPDDGRQTGLRPGRAPHVALVAWAFPPSRGSGVYRALALANALVAEGARVTVVTADEYFFRLVTGTDDSLVPYVDEAIELVRVPYDPASTEPIINRWPAHRIPSRQDSLATRESRKRKVRPEAPEREFFPENTFASWRPALEQAVHDLHRRDAVDLVLATGSPYTSFAAAAALAAHHGVPYVLDDRDAWLLDVYTGELRDFMAPKELWVRALVADALACWYVNPPIARWHRRRFPESAAHIEVVENGWDSQLLDPAATGRTGTGPQVLGFVGTVNAGLPLQDVVRGWRHARGAMVAADAELHLIGPVGQHKLASRQERLIASAERDGVVRRGSWPKARITQAYQSIDALLFLKEGGEMVTSGKVYEYVATGKPVAVVAQDAQDSRRILNGYPRSHIAASSSALDLAAAFSDALADSAGGDPTREAAAREFGASFRRDLAFRPAIRGVLAALADRGGVPIGGTR